MKTTEKKLLYNKKDVAKMIGVTKGVLRFACEYAGCNVIDWKNRFQMLNDGQVFEVIRAVRVRWSDEEIDKCIRDY